jgi:hypothetical protein
MAKKTPAKGKPAMKAKGPMKKGMMMDKMMPGGKPMIKGKCK